MTMDIQNMNYDEMLKIQDLYMHEDKECLLCEEEKIEIITFYNCSSYRTKTNICQECKAKYIGNYPNPKTYKREFKTIVDEKKKQRSKFVQELFIELYPESPCIIRKKAL